VDLVTGPAPGSNEVLLRARFDPRLPRYFLLSSTLGIACTFVGVLFLPIWLLGLGQRVHRRQYEALEAELTRRTLNVRKGFLFRTQQSFPLDKLTDLALHEGPILRWLGLCALRVETAGGGAGGTMGHTHMPGVVDAIGFRDAVLRQRDRVVGMAPEEPALASAPRPEPVSADPTLVEVRDALLRIERLLAEARDRSS
jgi:putative membrane protein